MNFEAIKDGLETMTQLTALDVLSRKMPLESLGQLNEPIDMYCLYAKDASPEGLDKQQAKELKEKRGGLILLLVKSGQKMKLKFIKMHNYVLKL